MEVTQMPFIQREHSLHYLLVSRAIAIVAVILFTTTVGKAKSTAVFDFVTNAGATGVTWRSSVGSLNYGAAYDAGGQASQVTLSGQPTIRMRPNTSSGLQPGYFVRGTYPVDLSAQSLGTRLSFDATVTLLGTVPPQGMTYRLLYSDGSIEYELTALHFTESSSALPNNTIVGTLSADVSAFAGDANVTLILESHAGTQVGNGTDKAHWADCKIVACPETTPFDFIDEADSVDTTWSDGRSGSNQVTFGDSCPQPLPGAAGCAGYISNVTLEDDETPARVLRVRPNAGTGTNVIEGDFELDTATLGPEVSYARIVAQVGFTKDTPVGRQARFSIGRRDDTGAFESLAFIDSTRDGELDELLVDITRYIGASETIVLRVKSNDSDIDEDFEPVWVTASVLGDDGVILVDLTDQSYLSDTKRVVWATGSGPLTFGGPEDASGTAEIQTSGTLQDGASYSDYLLTAANSDVAPYFVQGTLKNVGIPNNIADVRFVASIGFENTETNNDEVAYSVAVRRHGVENTFTVVPVVFDGTKPLDRILVNLSGFAGTFVDIHIRIDADTNSRDNAAWVEGKVVGQRPDILILKDAAVPVVAGDTGDDLTTLTDIIDAVSPDRPTELYFEPGQAGEYRFSDLIEAVNVEHSLSLKGHYDDPTEWLILDPEAGVFRSKNGRNVALHNLEIDYDVVPFAQGTVLARPSSTTIHFVPESDPSIMSLLDSRFTSCELCFGVFREALAPHRPVEDTHPTYIIDSVTDSGSGHLVVELEQSVPTSVVGEKISFVLRELGGESSGISASLVSDDTPVNNHLICTNVTMYTTNGANFSASGIEKGFIRNCAIKPGSGRVQSSNADGVIMKNCRFGADVISSSFENMMDDGFNFHGLGMHVIDELNNGTTFKLYAPGARVQVGDTLVLHNASTGDVGMPVEITSVSTESVNHCDTGTVELFVVDVTASPLGAMATYDTRTIQQVLCDSPPNYGDRFYSRRYTCADFLVSDCEFRNYRGRPWIGSAVRSTIQDCEFSYAFLGGAEYDNSDSIEEVTFNIGLEVCDVRILRNTFDHVGYNSLTLREKFGAVIRIGVFGGPAPISPNDTAEARDLRNQIDIHDNQFTDWPRHAILVVSAKNVSIDGNTFSNTDSSLWLDDSEILGAYGGIVYLSNAEDVTVSDNTVTDNRTEATVFNGKLFERLMVVTSPSGCGVSDDLCASGNTYALVQGEEADQADEVSEVLGF